MSNKLMLWFMVIAILLGAALLWWLLAPSGPVHGPGMNHGSGAPDAGAVAL
jgi:hypothetical protein